MMIEIKNGLRSGDKVLVVGQRNVNNGQKVKIIRTISDLEELSR